MTTPDDPLEAIRRDLAQAYANYFPSSEIDARWPSANDIASIHWMSSQNLVCRHKDLAEPPSDEVECGVRAFDVLSAGDLFS